jgi:hypothetical protein
MVFLNHLGYRKSSLKSQYFRADKKKLDEKSKKKLPEKIHQIEIHKDVRMKTFSGNLHI